VLGGASDIGQAIAGRLVDDGAVVVALAARRPERLAGAAAELRRRGATTVDAVAFDADDLASHERVIDEARERYGDLDIVVVAFGVLGDQAVAEKDPGAAAAVVSTNYVGAVSVLVHSEMTAGLPAAPLATTPEAVAEATVAGLRRRAAVVWVPRSLRPIMAVLRHLPRALFNRLPG